MKRYVIAVYVENKYGVLTRVAGLFMRRGFNIDSLTVGETENPDYSRITITLRGDEYAREQLFFSLPPSHPLADRKSLCLHDMNGETMLLRNRLGFWEHIISKDDKMPDTHFIVQNERDFNALVQASVLPYFASDWAMRREGTQPNRVYIPISDTEVHVTYHCCCLLQDKTMRAFLSQYLKNRS